MADELKSVIAESLPADGSAASSPAADVSSQSSETVPTEATVTKAEPKEVPFNQHPRWKEVLQDRDYWKQAAMEAIEKAKQPAPQPQNDPYSGMTLEEKAFWERNKKEAQAAAREVFLEESRKIIPELHQTRSEVTGLILRDFRKEHPDIQPGSEEEVQIAEKFKQYYRPGTNPIDALNDAYLLVTAPRKFKETEETVRKKLTEEHTKKQQNKIAANLEGPNIPPSSPVQGAKKRSTVEIVDDFLAGKLVA